MPWPVAAAKPASVEEGEGVVVEPQSFGIAAAAGEVSAAAGPVLAGAAAEDPSFFEEGKDVHTSGGEVSAVAGAAEAGAVLPASPGAAAAGSAETGAATAAQTSAAAGAVSLEAAAAGPVSPGAVAAGAVSLGAAAAGAVSLGAAVAGAVSPGAAAAGWAAAAAAGPVSPAAAAAEAGDMAGEGFGKWALSDESLALVATAAEHGEMSASPRLSTTSYEISSSDLEALNKAAALAEMPVAVRKRLYMACSRAIERTALPQHVALSWAEAKQDRSGFAQVSFLKQWAEVG